MAKYQNTINEKDRSKENVLYQRRPTNNCLSFSDPNTERDEVKRVRSIHRMIDEKIKGLPNSYYIEAVREIMVLRGWLLANDCKLDL